MTRQWGGVSDATADLLAGLEYRLLFHRRSATGPQCATSNATPTGGLGLSTDDDAPLFWTTVPPRGEADLFSEVELYRPDPTSGGPDDGESGPDLTRPPDNIRTTTCDSKLQGLNDSECARVPIKEVLSNRAFWRELTDRMPLYEDAFTIEVMSGFDNEEQVRLVRAAWTTLAMNFDLAVWAFCNVYGAPSGGKYGDNIGQLLDPERGMKVDFFIRGGFFHNASWNGLPGLGGGQIAWGEDWPDWLDLYQMWISGDNDDAACAVLDFSAVLFHELTHVVGLSLDDGNPFADPQNHCFESYLLENIYRWALFQRHPWVGQSSCCSALTSDRLFGDNGSRGASNRCLTDATATASGGWTSHYTHPAPTT